MEASHPLESISRSRKVTKDALVVVVSLLESEKAADVAEKSIEYKMANPDRRGNDMGGFLASKIASSLLGPDKYVDPTSSSSSKRVVWRRRGADDVFPYRFCVAVIVVSSQLVAFLEEATEEYSSEELSGEEGQSETSSRPALLRDLSDVIQARNCRDRVVLVFCLGIKIGEVKSRCITLRRLLDEEDSSTAIEVDGFSSGEHLNTTLQVCVTSTIEVLRQRFPEHLQRISTKKISSRSKHRQTDFDSEEVNKLARELKAGLCLKLTWSHFPSVQTRPAPHKLTVPQAMCLVRSIDECVEPSVLDTIQLRGNMLGDDFFSGSFASCLEHCPNMKYLHVSHNGIGPNGASALASVISKHLKRLEMLFIQDNRIGDEGFEALVDGLASRPSMKSLNADANQITVVPPSIGQLKNLVWLKLCRNKIRVLPREMANLKELEYLQLKGNPLQSPPVCIVTTPLDGSESAGDTTKEYVFEFFRGRNKNGSIAIRVLGDKGSGKTSFIRNCLRYHNVEPSTGTEQEIKLADGLSVSFMEFGGLDDSYPLHPAFLESVCTVYVVLYRADVPFASQGAIFWLMYIASLSSIHSMDEQYRSPLVLCSTFNDKASQPAQTASSIIEVLSRDEKDMFHDVHTKFALKDALTHDLDYTDERQMSGFWQNLNEVAIKTAGESDFLPGVYGEFLEFCRECARDMSNPVQAVDTLCKDFIEKHNLNAGEDHEKVDRATTGTALKVLTQLGELVHVSGMTHVYTTQHCFMQFLSRILSALETEGRFAGVCSPTKVKDVLNLQTITEAETLLKTMQCLSLCFPIPTVGLLDTLDRFRPEQVLGQQNRDSSSMWIFPSARRSASSRWQVLHALHGEGELHGKGSVTGLRFQTANSFLPPLLITLLEVRLRHLGVVLKATSNTVTLATAPNNRVILHYNDDLHVLDAVFCSETAASSRIAREILSVAVNRCVDTYFPKLAIKPSALCLKCLREEKCCSFPLNVNRRTGGYDHPENPCRCERSGELMDWPELVPESDEQTEWRDMWAFDVFISHAGEDTPLALDIYKWLTNLGLRCFVDETQLSHTADADLILPEAMRKCRFCVCVVTSTFCDKRWPVLEYVHFRLREQDRAQRALVPILIDLDPNQFLELTWDPRCKWISHDCSLKLALSDVLGEGRMDVGRGEQGFSVNALRAICEKVFQELQHAREMESGSNARLPRTLQTKYDAFVSHASEDKDIARPLADKLLEFGWNVFFDDESIRAGQNIRGAVYQALSSSLICVFVLTRKFFDKEWPLRETEIFRFESCIAGSFGSERIAVGIVPYVEWPGYLESNSLFKWITQSRAYTVKNYIKRVEDESLQSGQATGERIISQVVPFARDAANWLHEEIPIGGQ